MWGATGEQQWNAAITTGVDWKSLTLPACLPITTDYFPDERSLHVEHEVASDYCILPSESLDSSHPFGSRTMTPSQVFDELVSQRLAQGFQLCVDQEPYIDDPISLNIGNSPKFGGVGSLLRSRSAQEENTQEYKLSIGRVYHKIKRSGFSIAISIYRPRHPYEQLKQRYIYRFQAPDMGKYEIARAEFYTERLENYKWSYLDNYIVTKGESVEFPLEKNLKYWRFRIFIVPNFYQSIVKTLQSDPSSPCDIYTGLTYEEQQKTIDSFMKFFETVVHRIKKPPSQRKNKVCQIEKVLILSSIEFYINL